MAHPVPPERWSGQRSRPTHEFASRRITRACASWAALARCFASVWTPVPEAAANLGQWDRALLECAQGRPREVRQPSAVPAGE